VVLSTGLDSTHVHEHLQGTERSRFGPSRPKAGWNAFRLRESPKREELATKLLPKPMLSQLLSGQ